MAELRPAKSVEQMGGDGAVLAEELEKAANAAAATRAVILVEGASDRRALSALARRRGRDLDTEGITIIATTGATNFSRFVELLGPAGHNVPIAVLCDEREVGETRAALIAAGVRASEPSGLEASGCFVCIRDLEDELIRALGAKAMLELMEEHGDLRRFRSFQNQPAQRHKTIEAQIWRWLGNHKIRYARLMVDTIELDLVPLPLLRALDHHSQ